MSFLLLSPTSARLTRSPRLHMCTTPGGQPTKVSGGGVLLTLQVLLTWWPFVYIIHILYFMFLPAPQAASPGRARAVAAACC